MQVTVESTDAARAQADLLALPLFLLEGSQRRLPQRLAALDRVLGGRLAAALATGDFRGKRGESLLLYPERGGAKRLVLIGLGPEAGLDLEGLRRAMGQALGAASGRKAERLAFLVPALGRLRPAPVAEALAEGAHLAAYRFDGYRTRREEPAARLSQVALLFERGGDLRAARAGAATGEALATSQNVARDLSNEPANALAPSDLARAAVRVAKEVGLACRVLDVPAMKRLGMGALLAVGQGSRNPPRLVVLQHNAPRRGAARPARRRPTLCFVGKGITFDSGGISIKPAASMHEMKHDMSGAAAVIGALRVAALLRLPLHVVGVLAAAENLPSGDAYRPGDVLRAMSGTTIEVLNTDAEGRLVLADALHYARTQFSPAAIVDLATLTGACVVALGKWSAGLFGNDERLIERVRLAADRAGERVWPLPLWEEHREHIRGDVADIKNTGGRDGGALTAAAFLSHFTEGLPWAHLDIAGTAYTDKASPCQPRGATGVGVRLLAHLMRDWPSRGV
jgi:leucyl aminopeptidase